MGEERLLAEQAKTEVVTLRKHYSEADVNRTLKDVRGRRFFRLVHDPSAAERRESPAE